MSNSVQPQRQQPTRLPCPWDSPGKNNGVGCHFLLQCMKVKSEIEVTQSCPIPSDPMDWSPPGSSVLGIFQARVLEWVAIAFSVSCIDRQILYHWATRVAVWWDFRMNISSSQNTVSLRGFHMMMASMETPCHCSDPVSPPCLLPYPVSLG